MRLRARTHRLRGVRAAWMCVLAAALGLAACAEQDTTAHSSGADSGESVPAGATKAEYTAALAGMEPVTLQLQSTGAPGTHVAAPVEAYAAALEEWSGGTLRPEIAYSGAIAGLPEAGDAIADGRIDVAGHAPIYEPDEYPATNALLDLTFLGEHTPLVGRLMGLGAFVETAWESEELVSEQRDRGFQPMLPVDPVSPMVVLLCKEGPATTLADMNGLTARASGRAHVGQLESLGITPVSLDITEIYQGLQRGVIDCAELALSTADVVGAVDVANHLTYSPQAGFADSSTAMSVGQRFWDGLPPAAQQLMWDRLDVLVESSIRAGIATEVEAIEKIDASGGSIQRWREQAVAALSAHNEKTLDTARAEHPELVRELQANIEKWETIVTEELGYTGGGTFAELPDWYSAGDIDLDPFVSRFVQEVFAPHRPSATS